MELMHFENWFVESPQNKPCTSLFIISIMDVPTSILIRKMPALNFETIFNTYISLTVC